MPGVPVFSASDGCQRPLLCADPVLSAPPFPRPPQHGCAHWTDEPQRGEAAGLRSGRRLFWPSLLPGCSWSQAGKTLFPGS